MDAHCLGRLVKTPPVAREHGNARIAITLRTNAHAELAEYLHHLAEAGRGISEVSEEPIR